ncbi:unnamed protein product [Rotaria magnacalcarata]|uniref:NHL repeat containing protein n=1 Tax=Rotaria magnacalcarata TaxID=392030 RepID=A0A816U023_9BILA|nr:unnamed protein product [Rotaria magnacalcarata]CAF1375820.1 unnamed protein product [Rotaria magnacalcarata]CAF2105952.1 unnamed protein product [Rotaria magnacalcarata]CAF3772854.1 unnamed protein product [Rotaria magnacalcarata]CAF3798105.1 unnamed protein product [Rotaria magnacalcarata]
MFLSIGLAIIIALLSLTSSQTCKLNKYDQCSSNSHCAWLQLGGDAEGGVCAYIGDSCFSNLVPCENDNVTCVQSNAICVKHSRCHKRSVCYSMKLADPIICPPLTTTPTISPSSNATDGLCTTATWQSEGQTVAGGNGHGVALNQLAHPTGIFIDPNDNDALLVADSSNNRVMKWDRNASNGQIILGDMKAGNRSDQLWYPQYLTMDKQSTLFVIDSNNHRVQRLAKGEKNAETIISSINARGIALDQEEQQSLYLTVMNNQGDQVVKYTKNGEFQQVIAGVRNGPALTQFRGSQQLYVDRDGSVFVADSSNSRVMKWSLNASVGEIVAGGTGVGINSNNIGSPASVFVDRLGSIYVVDTYNERIVRWLKGALTGTIIAGGPGLGSSATLFEHPKDLAFDREGNL